MNRKGALFVTGATGCIGRRFLAALDPERYGTVYCLTREPGAAALPAESRFRAVPGDLESGETWASVLGEVESVVHLAAVTGKAPRSRFHDVNTEGTRKLVERCRQAGVARFLFVSTIAVRFADRSRYPYARSKELAERIVSGSGLDFAIVRPTQVIGERSGVWNGLRRLAREPFPVIPGNGRARVQPVDVDDLARAFVALLDRDRLGGAVIEVGGPEATTIEELVRRIYEVRFGRPPSRVFHVPLAPLAALLSWMEPLAGAWLPISAGQLSAFANDGTPSGDAALPAGIAPRRTLTEMLSRVAG